MNGYSYIFGTAFTFSKLKILDIIKANLKVPHPTLLLLAIGAGISAITVGIFYIVETGTLGENMAEAARKSRGSSF
jgi:hypothetical protein